MTPLSIQNRFRHPGKFETEFLTYLRKGGYRIDNSKTIADVVYYHQKTVTGQTSPDFFTGNFDAPNTNLVGSFVRPQTEHAVIWGVRLLLDDAPGILPNVLWTPGTLFQAIPSNAKMTITNNSEVQLKNFPLTEALDNLTTKDNGLITLSQPILWAGQTELKVNISVADSAVPFEDLNIRVQLMGIGLI